MSPTKPSTHLQLPSDHLVPLNLEPLQVIRTETVLSKLPIHNLAKRGTLNIHISRKNGAGAVELFWEVSPNRRHGEPRELAYKIDTLVVNRRLDDLGRPLPKIIRLGSLRHIAAELGIDPRNPDQLKKALLQNASAFINCKINYKSTDGTTRRLEAGFTRYGVVFTGEQLPDGRKADSVYITLNDPYWEVLNNAPVRPLDYDYLKALTPSSQRFYEVASYRIYATLKYNHHEARMLYSEYCLFAGQPRYHDWNHVKKQMYKLHRTHLASKYLKTVRFEPTTDDEGNPDWFMLYVPGPKARAEFRAFERRSGSRRETQPTLDVPTISATSPPAQQLDLHLNTDPLKAVQYFHRFVRNVENYEPSPRSSELNYAAELLQNHGLEKVNFIISHAAREAKRTKFRMQTLNAIRQYVSGALQEFETLQRRRQQERHDHQQQQASDESATALRARMDARLNSLTPDQYQQLYEKVKAELHFTQAASPTMLKKLDAQHSFIRGLMFTELQKTSAPPAAPAT